MSVVDLVQEWHADGDNDGIYVCATWLHDCGDGPANEALAELAEVEGLRAVPCEVALRTLSQRRSTDLVRWCLHTAARVYNSAAPDPSRWLPALTHLLDAAGHQIPDAHHRVALADMVLLHCSDMALVNNAIHIQAYQAVREHIFRTGPGPRRAGDRSRQTIR